MNIEISTKEYERTLNWYDAMLYCQLLVIDNKNDWRLPTNEELLAIYEIAKDLERSLYWASIEFGDNFSWYRHMAPGIEQPSYGSKGNIFYVRPIRSITI